MVRSELVNSAVKSVMKWLDGVSLNICVRGFVLKKKKKEKERKRRPGQKRVDNAGVSTGAIRAYVGERGIWAKCSESNVM